MHKLGVLGVGYVGSAVSECFELLLQDKVEIREYDKFKPTESLETVVNHSNVLFVCVPTPMREDGSCDTTIVESVVEELNATASKPKAVVIKSTLPPGTTQRLQDKYPKHSFVFNPEFLTEKRFIEDFLEQDRIILGFTSNKQQFFRVDKLFQDFIGAQKKSALIVKVPSEQAEMLKYATNCFLATKLSFFNEIYQICQAANVDYGSVVSMLKLDKRVGGSHMGVPGPDGQLGWAKSCFPKDINALISFAKDSGVDPLMLESACTKNLLVRDRHDWQELPQVSGNYKKKPE